MSVQTQITSILQEQLGQALQAFTMAEAHKRNICAELKNIHTLLFEIPENIPKTELTARKEKGQQALEALLKLYPS